MDKDPFDFYRFGFSNNAVIRGTVNSGYKLMLTIGIVGILVTLILAGIKLMSSNHQQRAEALEDIKWKVIVSVILFSIPTIIGLMMSLAGSFV